MTTIGVVVIGRNEGDRLVKCLESLRGVSPLVYVDSGSSDNSQTNAKALGACVVDLDMSRPFSAGRARNEGFQKLLLLAPDVSYVFFVDGDCEVLLGWIDQAVERLSESPELAAVCGRRKEMYPLASIFNQLCDIEWNTPVGAALACGGDAIYRVSVFRSLNGFDPGFIAGEEPELCFRIRQAGYKIERMDVDMTGHDAAMTSVKQWWKRTERSGHAYYLGWSKHGRASHEHYYERELKSIVAWVGLSLLLICASVVFQTILPFLALVLLWCLQIAKIYFRLDERVNRYPVKTKISYSASLVFGKFAQALGVFRAWRKQRLGLQATIVEYK